jgi:hypothetical protein
MELESAESDLQNNGRVGEADTPVMWCHLVCHNPSRNTATRVLKWAITKCQNLKHQGLQSSTPL